MSRKAHADFQNCLPDNKLGRDRIFSVRGLVTHDWRDVGDGIRSRAGDSFFSQIHRATKMEILSLNLFATPAQSNDPGRNRPTALIAAQQR